MLLNKPRAYEIMDKYGLDGLVAKEAINVYYLSDYWDLFSSGGWTFNSYAVLPRREDAPAGLLEEERRLGVDERQGDELGEASRA